MECVEIRALSFSYPGGERPALSDVSLGVERGQLAALCGPSGGGKTTLLRLLKPAAAPVGEMGGDIVFDGAPLSGLPARRQASAIGYVGQSPENQIVTDKVWHELAFGLESLGLENGEIRRRTAEMAAFFGISDWFYRDAASLSGGQKQILNLASVMVMQPELLLLDEPTSRLDPVAAADFLAAVGRINRELGTTVIIAEHRLGEVLPMAGAVHVLDGGQLIFSGAPGETGEYLRRHSPGIFLSMPEPMRIWSAVPNTLPCPITPQEGAGWLARLCRLKAASAGSAGENGGFFRRARRGA
jgi:energy-coupling factor transporter ATP-binding protein EcfA2